MTRLRWNIAITGLALTIVTAVVAAAGQDRRPVTAANDLELPNQWRWELHRAPVMEVPALCRLMVRHREVAQGPQALAAITSEPLTARQADEHPLALDSLPPGVMANGVVGIDLLDLRQLGEPSWPGQYPLRAKVVLKTNWSVATSAISLAGHSVRGRPVVHDDDWADGEVNLLTFTTVSTESIHTYTFFLTIRPCYE